MCFNSVVVRALPICPPSYCMSSVGTEHYGLPPTSQDQLREQLRENTGSVSTLLQQLQAKEADNEQLRAHLRELLQRNTTKHRTPSKRKRLSLSKPVTPMANRERPRAQPPLTPTLVRQGGEQGVASPLWGEQPRHRHEHPYRQQHELEQQRARQQHTTQQVIGTLLRGSTSPVATPRLSLDLSTPPRSARGALQDRLSPLPTWASTPLHLQSHPSPLRHAAMPHVTAESSRESARATAPSRPRGRSPKRELAF